MGRNGLPGPPPGYACPTSLHDATANIFDEMVLKFFIDTIAKPHVKRLSVREIRLTSAALKCKVTTSTGIRYRIRNYVIALASLSMDTMLSDLAWMDTMLSDASAMRLS